MEINFDFGHWEPLPAFLIHSDTVNRFFVIQFCTRKWIMIMCKGLNGDGEDESRNWYEKRGVWRKKEAFEEATICK